MGSALPHHTSDHRRQSMMMLENDTSVMVPSSRFCMPRPRLLALMMQLAMVTLYIESMFSDPIFTAHEREVMVQLVTVMLWQEPYSANSRRFSGRCSRRPR